MRHNVIIPDSDRFVPFALTINKGDSIQWTNNDSDAHTVVSVDSINKISPSNINYTLKPNSTYTLKFKQIGQWIYYCRFHSRLDEYNQPVAPGCNNGEIGGISGKFVCGNQVLQNNYGTPMFGVVTILPKVKSSKKENKHKKGEVVFLQ